MVSCSVSEENARVFGRYFPTNTVKISEPPKAIATLSRGVVKVSGSHETGCQEPGMRSLIALMSEASMMSNPPNPTKPNPGVIKISMPISNTPSMKKSTSSMPESPAM